MVKEDCIFCKIANGQIPSKTLYEDEDFRVILDLGPATEGHALILPKEHAANLFELSEEQASKALLVAQTLDLLSPFLWRAPPLEMQRECPEFFPDQAGKESLVSSYEAEKGLLWMCAGPSCFLSGGDGCVGNFLSCRKGVKDPLEVPGVRCD